MLLYWLEEILMVEMGGEKYDCLNECLQALFEQ